MSVNHGSGDYASVTTGQKREKGSTVLIAAYSTLLGVKVRNPTTDGWIGSVEYSDDGGDSYVPFLCTDCDTTFCGTTYCDTTFILVDGDSAPTNNVYSDTCSDGKSCILKELSANLALGNVLSNLPDLNSLFG